MEIKDRTIALLIDSDNVSSDYFSILLDELSQYSTIEHEIIVQDEYWLIDYYPDNEDRTLYGIMPDSGADYALMIWRDDGEKDTQNDLMTVREALGI